MEQARRTPLAASVLFCGQRSPALRPGAWPPPRLSLPQASHLWGASPQCGSPGGWARGSNASRPRVRGRSQHPLFRAPPALSPKSLPTLPLPLAAAPPPRPRSAGSPPARRPPLPSRSRPRWVVAQSDSGVAAWAGEKAGRARPGARAPAPRSLARPSWPLTTTRAHLPSPSLPSPSLLSFCFRASPSPPSSRSRPRPSTALWRTPRSPTPGRPW